MCIYVNIYIHIFTGWKRWCGESVGISSSPAPVVVTNLQIAVGCPRRDEGGEGGEVWVMSWSTGINTNGS